MSIFAMSGLGSLNSACLFLFSPMTSPIMKIKHTTHVMSNFLRACVLSWCFKLVSFRLWQWKACVSRLHSDWVLRYSSSELSSRLDESFKTEWRNRDRTLRITAEWLINWVWKTYAESSSESVKVLFCLLSWTFSKFTMETINKKILPNSKFQINSACNLQGRLF